MSRRYIEGLVVVLQQCCQITKLCNKKIYEIQKGQIIVDKNYKVRSSEPIQKRYFSKHLQIHSEF